MLLGWQSLVILPVVQAGMLLGGCSWVMVGGVWGVCWLLGGGWAVLYLMLWGLAWFMVGVGVCILWYRPVVVVILLPGLHA